MVTEELVSKDRGVQSVKTTSHMVRLYYNVYYILNLFAPLSNVLNWNLLFVQLCKCASFLVECIEFCDILGSC